MKQNYRFLISLPNRQWLR